MKLIQDEGAYRQLIQKFLAGRSTAGAFISSLSRLWKSDGAPVGGNSAVDVDADADTHPAITPGFYGLMDSVNSLCEDYTSCLPDGSKTIERPAQLIHIAWRLCASAYRPGRQARRTLGSWM